MAAALASAAGTTLRADETSSPSANQWALLIGVGQYEKAPKLPYIDHDVEAMADVLKRYGGLSASHLRLVYDGSADSKPGKENIEKAIGSWLTKPSADGTLIVYFSGHGFQDNAGRLYLAPLECDPANPTEKGIPVEWIRQQFEACPAKFKLLILDACHAGAEKGDDAPTGVTAKDLGDAFKQTPGVVTLASSTAEEKSQIWDFKQHSLFTYWLKEGLKGHADTRGDGVVTFSELYEYVFNHVQETANVRLQRKQTPVQIVGPRTPGVPVVVKLRPQGLKQVLADMSEQLAGALEEHQIRKVGVLEFTNDTKLGEALGANFGLLGKYCGDEIERTLGTLSSNKYAVIDRGRLLPAMKEQRFVLKDLNSTEAMQKLSGRVGGLPVVARGTLRDRTGRLVTLRCRLEETTDGARLSDVGGLAVLSDSEWAMIGRSAEIHSEDHEPDPDAPTSVAAPGVIESADEQSHGAHPLRDPNFPFPVRIMVGGKERKGVFKKVGEGKDEHEDYIVPLKAGEVYQIWIQSRQSDPFAARVLVDGLNTLPEKEATKGVTTWVWAKPTPNLGDARAWSFVPKGPKTRRIDGLPTWYIRGFAFKTGEQGGLRTFTVVDADNSLAARQQFANQIGLITLAFYAEKGGPRAVGTAGGEKITTNLEEKDFEVGELRAVVHIRYVEPSALGM